MTHEEFIEGVSSCIEATPIETIEKGFGIYMELLSKIEKVTNLVVQERIRQLDKGYSEELDDKYTDAELPMGALSYITYAIVYDQILNTNVDEDISKDQIESVKFCAKAAVNGAKCWPFLKEFDPHGNVKEFYIKAMAMLVAEIQRIDRRDKIIKDKQQAEWENDQLQSAIKTE